MAVLTPALQDWLRAQLGSTGPFEVTPISGGHSNETSVLSAPDGRWILRRPPATAISATANNLGRECEVMTALAGTGVPVPRVMAYSPADGPFGGPVLVMSHVAGHPLTDTWPETWPGSARVGDVGQAAVETLAALHAVDHEAVGLAGFGRPQGYLARQVARWLAQVGQNTVRVLPEFAELGGWLQAHLPAEQPPAILHGDFHLDNCLVVPGPPARVAGVIDWELATIGDPLVDLGLLLAFWGPDRAEPVAMPAVQALTRTASAPSRQELADLYAARSGRSVEALGWYMTLAMFKLAAIVEGAYARFATGRSQDPWDEQMGEDVPRLLADAARFTG